MGTRHVGRRRARARSAFSVGCMRGRRSARPFCVHMMRAPAHGDLGFWPFAPRVHSGAHMQYRRAFSPIGRDEFVCDGTHSRSRSRARCSARPCGEGVECARCGAHVPRHRVSSLDSPHTRVPRLHTHRGWASGTWLLRPGTPSPATHNGTASAVQQVLRPFLAVDAPLPPGSTRPQPPPPPRSLALSSARATYRET